MSCDGGEVGRYGDAMELEMDELCGDYISTWRCDVGPLAPGLPDLVVTHAVSAVCLAPLHCDAKRNRLKLKVGTPRPIVPSRLWRAQVPVVANLTPSNALQ